MRRLFAADSLRSNNPYSLGTAPHCGAGWRRLFAADSLRFSVRLGGLLGGRSWTMPPAAGPVAAIGADRCFGAEIVGFRRISHRRSDPHLLHRAVHADQTTTLTHAGRHRSN